MKKLIIILLAVFVLAVCGVGASYASELTDLSTWTYDSTQETWVPDPSSYNFSAIFSSGGGHNWETILYVQANGDTTAQVAIAVAGFTEDPSDMQEFGFQTERGPFTEVSNLSIGGTFFYEPKYNLDGFFYERQSENQEYLVGPSQAYASMITNGGGPINASDIGDLAFVKPTPGGGRTFTELQATGTVVPEPATFIMFGILGIIGAIKKRFF